MLLQNAIQPILRFYRWRQPTVSLGYFSRWSEANAFADGRPLVRRWTGGGIVPHGSDLTYSLIVPGAVEAWKLPSRQLYQQVHQAVARSLRTIGVPAELSRAALTKVSDACFANPVHFDVIANGWKIAGAAHRRTSSGLLHQGSIQRGGLDSIYRAELASALADVLMWDQLDVTGLEQAQRLAQEKYASIAWLQRR
jgi:lipoyl(octanoyl) transferase